MSKRLEILNQISNAASDQERAQLLLQVPDAVLLKYQTSFFRACQRAAFKHGTAFISLRVAALSSVRDESGLMPEKIAGPLEDYRSAFTHFAAGRIG